jgi:hypothetical protein
VTEKTESVIPFDFDVKTDSEPLRVEFDVMGINTDCAVNFVYLVFEDTQKLRNALEKKS